MCKWKTFIGMLVIVFVVLPLALWRIPSCQTEGGNVGPRDVAELIPLVEKLGLHWRSDREDGDLRTARVIVSEEPLPWEAVGALVPGDPDKSIWTSKVAAYRKSPGPDIGIGNAVAWGEFQLYGDEALIRKLTGSADPNKPLGDVSCEFLISCAGSGSRELAAGVDGSDRVCQC
jgi:hypothetical protein